MAEVPRISGPQVEPSGFIPQTATPEAFGAQVGQATQKLGGAIDEFGDVLAKHAITMQKQMNAATAKEAFFNATAELGQAEAEYRSLQGKAAVDAHPAYIQKLKEMREKWVSSIQNPDARRIFDQDFTRRLGFTVVDSAHYAAAQRKQYVLDANKAVLDRTVEDAQKDPENGGLVESNRKIAHKAIDDIAEQKGEPPERRQLQKDIWDSSTSLLRVQSIARNDPEKAEQFLEANKDKMLPSDVNAAQDVIKKRRDAQFTDYERGQRLLKQAFQDRSDKKEVQILKDLENNPEKVTNNSILDDKELTRTSQERLLKYVKSLNKPDSAAVVSDKNSNRLLEQMRLPEGDPNKITTVGQLMDAKIKGDINRTDFNWLRDILTKQRDESGTPFNDKLKPVLGIVRPYITKSNVLMGTNDPEGEAKYKEFQRDVMNLRDQLVKEGKDPHVLLTPGNPEYVGDSKFVVKYSKSMQESQKTMIDRVRGFFGPSDAGGPPKPRAEQKKPGESWADFKKRTGIQ